MPTVVVDADDSMGGSDSVETSSQKQPRRIGRDRQGRRRGLQRHDQAPKVELEDLDALVFTGLNDRVWFCVIVTIEVLANMMVIGIETDNICRHNCDDGDFSLWLAVDKVFAALGIIDVLAVLIHLGPKLYFRGFYRSGARMIPFDVFRTLDFAIVFIRAFDSFFLAGPGQNSGLKYLSLLRVMHTARFANKVQLVGAFRELWLILAGMADTMRTVFWVIALLLLILWLFAVVVTITVGDPEQTYNYSDSVWTKDDYWGSVPKSLWSLCQVLTRDKWSNPMVWPLVEGSPAVMLIFALFFCVALLALLNTIVGVVVESTLRSARDNEEKAARERQKLDQKIMSNLEQVFLDADTDGNGLLERKELHDALKMPRVKKAVQIVGLPVGDLDLLFNLLDENNTGRIQTDQFFRGCTRLRGPAMARDLQHMSVDLVRHISTATSHIQNLHGVNNSIGVVLDLLDQIEVDIMQDDNGAKDPVLMARRKRTQGAASRGTFLRKASMGSNLWESDFTSSEVASDEPHDLGIPGQRGDILRSLANGGIGGNELAWAEAGNRLALDMGPRANRHPHFESAEKPPPPPLPAHIAKNLQAIKAMEESDSEKIMRKFGEPRLEIEEGAAPLRKYGNRGQSSFNAAGENSMALARLPGGDNNSMALARLPGRPS